MCFVVYLATSLSEQRNLGQLAAAKHNNKNSFNFSFCMEGHTPLKTGFLTRRKIFTHFFFFSEPNKMGLMDIVPPGVVTGANLMKLMEYCRDNAVSIS